MNNDQTIGKITSGLYLQTFIGNGKTDDGKEFTCCAVFGSCEPLLTYNHRTFMLTWDDIVKLAEKAGLFEEEKKEAQA